MNLQFGLTSPSPAWEDVFQQEGVSFARIDLAHQSPADYSVVVVSGALRGQEKGILEEYLRAGGAIVGYAAHLEGLGGTKVREEFLEYLVPDSRDGAVGVRLIDLAVPGAISREANVLRTQDNSFALFAGELAGGFAVLLPFDPGMVLADTRAVNRNFYSSRDRLPSERVSVVSRGEVRHLLHWAFKHVHHARGIPYVHLWYFPGGKRNLFAFRVDTDRGSRQEIDELYGVAVRGGMSMSWFLDVKSHEAWIGRFRSMVAQEFGVHCYQHKTYATFEENLRNITTAKRLMEEAGLEAAGFSAPYGEWNRQLARAIDASAFEYSSEFAYAYDTLPLLPRIRDRRFETLQLPIHPVAIGSLARIGYTEKQMKEYYRRVIDEKLARYEPLFFYHHPTHRSWDVVEFIFDYVKGRGVDNQPLVDYARWWKRRGSTHYGASFDAGALKVVGSGMDAPGDVWVRGVWPDGSEAIAPIGETFDWKARAAQPPESVPPCPADIRRMRDVDVRTTIGDIFTSISRKFT